MARIDIVKKPKKKHKITIRPILRKRKGKKDIGAKVKFIREF